MPTTPRRILAALLLAASVAAGATACTTTGIRTASVHPAEDTATRSSATPTPRPVVTTREVSETTPIPFTSSTVDDPALPQGQTRVVTAGVDGVTTTVFRVTTTDGVETGREQLSQSTTLAPVAQVTANGSYVAPPPAPAPPAAAARTVVPGAFCSASDNGVTAVAANGRSYTCGGKGADASGRLHWNC